MEAMGLDWRVCSRARLARDARFDGKFFIGVLTTKVYCRPTCPARTCKESNVRYFANAAAAAEAGFRPCLRCRPECSPGNLAWAGTQNTVARALRLIGESGMGDGGVEGLAEQLGVGSRHLRRLFLKHVGATPSAVVQTRRLHFAKKLIDETRLPMTQVAIAAGFGCVRRFNECIRRVYHRTPTHIRRLAGRSRPQREGLYIFHLHFRPPYNWMRTLEFLAARATPGVEAVDGGNYRRTISLSGNLGHFEISLEEGQNALTARVDFGDPCALFAIIEQIDAMFDSKADWAVIAKTLRSDSALERRVDAESGLRAPGCWNGFELTTRAILGQQTSVKEAMTIAGRIVRAYGQAFAPASGLTHVFPTAEILKDADLVSVGVPRAKAATLRAFACAVCDGSIRFERIVDCGDLVKQLCEIPGIGKWTAQYIGMSVVRDPDAFPSDDLVLQCAIGERSAWELERRSEAWRPWRAYAAMLLWLDANDAVCGAVARGSREAKTAFVSTALESPP